MENSDKGGASAKRPCASRHLMFSKARGFVFALVFVLVGASLVWHIGGGTLSAMGIGPLAVVCPVGALEAMLGAKAVMLHPVLLLGLTVALVLVFGKAFCSWLCPTPRLQGFLRPGWSHKSGVKGEEKPAAMESRLSDSTVRSPEEEPTGIDDRFAAEEASPAGHLVIEASDCGDGCGSCSGCKGLPPVGGKRDGIQLDSRHGVLVGALASAAIFGFPVFCLVCPIGLTFATFIGVWHLLQFNETTWGLLLFPAILLLELVFLRRWCHRFCPISALLSLISVGNRSFRPRVDSRRCLREQGIDCRACVEACPEEVDPHSADTPECSKCGRCAEVCPVGAISFPLRCKGWMIADGVASSEK